jgi:hypothetical protein
MKKWVTAIAVLVGLSAVGLLVYWQWDPIWAFVFSPIGGFVTKILLTTKALKVVVGAAVAVGAGVVAIRKKLRRDAPEPEPRLAPPVFGPPEEASPVAAPPAAPPAGVPAAVPAFTSAGTVTATTTEPATAPASRPI